MLYGVKTGAWIFPMDVGFLEVSSASPSAIRLERGPPSFVVVVAPWGVVIVELQRCRRRQRFWCGVRFTVEVFVGQEHS